VYVAFDCLEKEMSVMKRSLGKEKRSKKIRKDFLLNLQLTAKMS